MAATLFVAANYVAGEVLAAVESQVLSYFSFESRQFGESVHLSNVYAALQGVAGVAGLDITLLQYKDPGAALSHGASMDPVQIHMRINDNELATLQDPIGDALVTLGQAPL